ncbi:uncharacterized protein LOC122397975 [Colletes gigas]|uniref:uncharacterized protein LOC122397975 n=1 Tax=Colletes gigas TaxID=935657 RepID=UPI001C9B9DDE|nr:uncharacterized protein LOC122397975 [Colletes gigas]
MDEHTQAISFANNYFALVDGLASGLENHLSNDVVLDWFGRTIRGRKNVTAFMEAHKVNSRHKFRNIVPIASIGYKKKRSNRKKIFSYQSRSDQESLRTDNDNPIERELSAQESSEVFSKNDPIVDFNQNEIDPKGMIAMHDDTFYDLSEGDLSNLFKLEMSSTNIEEIERSINRIKLEEEMAPTIKAIKRECGQGDGPAVVETSSIKYVEAEGEIEFSRKYWKRDAWNAYFSATTGAHTWRRPCKLQIAYSISTECSALEPSSKSKNSTTCFGQPKARLLTLEEINEITNRLIPNTNDFGGFLKDVNFFEDRKCFLKELGTELAIVDPCTPTLVPHYVDNKLIFNKPCVDVDDCHDRNRKKFIFNYQIHLIIYEASNKCRMNLLSKFEKTKI